MYNPLMSNAHTDQINQLLNVATERNDIEVVRICKRALAGSKRAIREALDTIEHRLASQGAL